jgi:hypothetical protein
MAASHRQGPQRSEREQPSKPARPPPELILQTGIGRAEQLIYLSVALLLIVAAVFTVVGMVSPLVEGGKSRDITDAGVFILDRILLLFIIAELLYTLHLVMSSGGQILVEPFLFIGLIAVMRRILVITAELEGNAGRREVTDFLLQIGALAGLAVVLVPSIYVLRRSAVRAG